MSPISIRPLRAHSKACNPFLFMGLFNSSLDTRGEGVKVWRTASSRAGVQPDPGFSNCPSTVSLARIHSHRYNRQITNLEVTPG